MLLGLLGVFLVSGCNNTSLDNVQKDVIVNNIKVKERKELYSQTDKIMSEIDIEGLALNYFYSLGNKKDFIEFLVSHGMKRVFEQDLNTLFYSLDEYVKMRSLDEGKDLRLEGLVDISQDIYEMQDGSVIHDIVITDNRLLNYTVSIKWVGDIVEGIEIYKY